MNVFRRVLLVLSLVAVCGKSAQAQQTKSEAREARIAQAMMQLERGDVDTQAQALYQLAQLDLKPEQGVPLFRRYLKRKTQTLGEALAITHAVEGLAQYGPAAAPAIPDLTALLEDVGSVEGQATNGGQIEWWLTTALAKIGPNDADAIAALKRTIRRGLASPEKLHTVTQESALALSQMGQGAHTAVPLIISALDNERLNDAGVYAFALSRMMPEAAVAVPHLVQAMEAGREPEAIVKALGEMGAGARPALPALRRVLHEAAPALSVKAFAAIGQIEGVKPLSVTGQVGGGRFLSATEARHVLEQAAEALRLADIPHTPTLVSSPSPSLRDLYSAFATVRQSGRYAVPVLTELVKSKGEPWLRRTALETLAAIGPSGQNEAALLLLDAAQSKDPVLELDSSVALAGFKAEDSGTARELSLLLATDRPKVREEVSTLLYGMGEKALPALPALLKALERESTNADLRLTAGYLRVLSHFGPAAHDAVPPLTRLFLKYVLPQDVKIGQTYEWMQVLLLTTLMKIGVTTEVLPGVREMLRSSEPTTVACAAHAVGLLGHPAADTVPLLTSAFAPDFRDRYMTREFFYGYVYETSARLEAIQSLGILGADAKEAIPLLRSYALRPDPHAQSNRLFPDLQRAAQKALQQIEP